ncbi:hypothetical protein LTR70_005432 [Exophiala xenobiotica]|uniref:Uncharacterized protein n=1 Tax=Lithohypha guttulata TaxID=1690604 RepID=A0ABR0KAS5_9EURO|nr:hypothetical protein LTR24_005174 [Lithohypha guttulata]KAK5318410.1 hypothetical protein LTR70_005432 [Exophiala xenobiotica]
MASTAKVAPAADLAIPQPRYRSCMMEEFRLGSAQHAPYFPGLIKQKDRTKYLGKVIDDAMAHFDDFEARNKAESESTLMLMGDRGIDLRQKGEPGGSGRTCYPIHDLRLCDCCAPSR